MSTVNIYSLKADGDRRLSPHFHVREFACHDGTDRILIAEELVAMLQAIRNHYGVPLGITSGYRTPDWNRRVGGVKHSQHLLGNASDIHVAGQWTTDLYRDIVHGSIPGIDPGKMGVGLYKTFVHVDVRGHRARWAGKDAHIPPDGQ